jgi:hypothetical protein
MKLISLNNFFVAAAILLFSSLSLAGDRQCSSSWDPDAEEGARCVARQIVNDTVQAPSDEYMRRYTTRESCLSYCESECTMPVSVTMCVQRNRNSVLKICRDRNLFESFGYPIPKTSSDCSDVD